MNLLSLVASVTQRATVVSEQILDHFSIPVFGYNDSILGKVAVVQETGDPTAPTTDVAIDNSSGVSLTDGKGTVYANALVLAVSNINEINFSLAVISDTLTAALLVTDDDSIEAFLEVRATTADGQDVMILKEPTAIVKSAASGSVPVSVRNIMFNSDIDTLRGGSGSLEELSTLSPVIPTETLLIITRSETDAASFWQLVSGDADDGDPDGQVRPLDYDNVTNNRHWAKKGGL